MKKRGNVAISTLYSSSVDSSSHVNEKSVETVSWTLLPSRAFFVLSKIKIKSERPSQFCFTSWKGFCLTWTVNVRTLRISSNNGSFSEGICFWKLDTLCRSNRSQAVFLKGLKHLLAPLLCVCGMLCPRAPFLMFVGLFLSLASAVCSVPPQVPHQQRGPTHLWTSTTSLQPQQGSASAAVTPCARSPLAAAPWSSSLRSELCAVSQARSPSSPNSDFFLKWAVYHWGKKKSLCGVNSLITAWIGWAKWQQLCSPNVWLLWLSRLWWLISAETTFGLRVGLSPGCAFVFADYVRQWGRAFVVVCGSTGTMGWGQSCPIPSTNT